MFTTVHEMINAVETNQFFMILVNKRPVKHRWNCSESWFGLKRNYVHIMYVIYKKKNSVLNNKLTAEGQLWGGTQ